MAMPRSASAGGSSRNAIRFSAPSGSPAASERAAEATRESMSPEVTGETAAARHIPGNRPCAVRLAARESRRNPACGVYTNPTATTCLRKRLRRQLSLELYCPAEGPAITMTTISKDAKLVTLINVFTVAPANQRHLVELLARATDTSVRHAPGFVSASLHRSLDGTRVTIYAQWRTI